MTGRGAVIATVLPPQCMWRLARDPIALPRVNPIDGPNHRFDDPEQEFSVRYFADGLVGCLLETMQRFRPPISASDVDRRLASIDGLVATDHEADIEGGIADWLAEQWVGEARLTESEDRLVDLRKTFDALDREPRIHEVLQASFPESPHLDFSHVLAGGQGGRAVTQVISRVIYEAPDRPAGIQYPSRREPEVTCWAVFDRSPIAFDAPVQLDPHDASHRASVQHVADRYRIPLPPDWL